MENRIKQRMQELPITQEELGRLAGISQPAIHKLLSGKTKRTTRLAEIARALRVRLEWLVTGEEPMQGDLAADDQKFLAAYHELPPEEKTAVQILVFRGRPRSSPTPAPPDQERRTG